MNILEYTYSPKNSDIAYLQVSRPQGYNKHRIHMHDHHELVLVSSQVEFSVISNGDKVHLRGPCVILNRLGAFHEVVEISQGHYDSHVIFFHPRVFTHLPEDMVQRKQLLGDDLLVVSLSPTQLKMLKPLFLLVADRPYAQQRPLLLAVLSAVAQILQEGAFTLRLHTSDNYIFHVIELLRNEQASLTIPQLSEKFHVCSTKLKSDFKRIVGMPIMTYRNLLRLDKARNLLESTDMAVSQITYACGFSDESYFIRSFRKAYGTTPATYRRSASRS